MRPIKTAYFTRLVVFVMVLALLPSCSRQHYRRKADKDVYSLLQSGGARDSRWKLDDYRIDVDPKSRMYDRHNPDKQPMPLDDASAHVKMHKVGGMKGAKNWHKNGTTKFVENPSWRQNLLYNEDGAVPLNIDGAVELALLHSPEYQSALENLYLAAAVVSQERFRFDTQFYGGESLFYTANGRLRGGDMLTTNDIGIEAQKLFATGGELVVGLANSITWTFNGQNSWYADSIFNVGFVQPLLRTAGRKVVLENLTQAERDFLAAIRQMVYFQQGFYTRIVTGSGGRATPSGGISVNLPNLAGGYYGLLAYQIQIQNARQNTIGLEDNLRRLEELFAANQIDDVFQVQEMRQSLLTSESSILAQIANYQSQVETYLRSLGLPPDLKVEINDPVMEQFQLMSSTITALQEDIGLLLTDIRKKDAALPDNFPARIENAILRTRSEMKILENDLETLKKATPERIASLQALEVSLSEQIRQGERIESAIYDSNEFTRRVQLLREMEIPANLSKLEAAFYLLQLAMGSGEIELRRMIETDSFPPEAREAMKVLRMVAIEDLAGSLTIQMNMTDDLSAKREELLKAQRELESLEQLVERERLADNDTAETAETTLPEAPPALTPKTLAQTKDDTKVNEAKIEMRVANTERTSDEELNAKQIIAELLQEDKYRDWLQTLLTEFQNEVATLSISQVKTRLDSVNLMPIDISEADALKIAEENRLDWMNRRAALVDSWRQIDLAANNLKGDLNVRVEGEIGTIDRKGVRFDAENGRLRVGLEWDSPLTRHNEMLDYRRSQIAYQAARRDYYTYVDSVDAELRNLLRDLRLAQIDFEIRRNAILIAAKKVDVAQLNLIRPAERGTQIDSNTAMRVINSLSEMSGTQNDFISTWVDYQTSRMLLDMSMGTMELDRQGRWIDPGRITKDRVGPVARHGGRNAVPGLTPKSRPHHAPAAKKVAKHIVEAAPHEIPAAPRLKTENANPPVQDEPTPAPEEAATSTGIATVALATVEEPAPMEARPVRQQSITPRSVTKATPEKSLTPDTLPARSTAKRGRLQAAPLPPKSPE